MAAFHPLQTFATAAMLPIMKACLMPVVACLLVGGCASPAAPRDAVDDSIRACGLTSQIRVEMEGERRLHILYINPKTDYAKVDCFLAEARRLRLDLGFVGNEAPSSK